MNCSPHPLPLLLIFRTPSQFCFLRASYWKHLLHRLAFSKSSSPELPAFRSQRGLGVRKRCIAIPEYVPVKALFKLFHFQIKMKQIKANDRFFVATSNPHSCILTKSGCGSYQSVASRVSPVPFRKPCPQGHPKQSSPGCSG